MAAPKAAAGTAGTVAAKQEPKYSMGVLPFDGQHVWLWGRRLPAHFLLSSKKHGTYEVQADAVNFYCRSELNNEAKCCLCRILL